LHLKTVQTPSAQLASLMTNGPQPTDNVNELIETYKHSLAAISGDGEQQQEWDDLDQLRQHTAVTPSVQHLLDQAQVVLSGKSLPKKAHFNNAGLAGALSLIDEGLSHTVHAPAISADEAYRRVLHATHSSPPSSSKPHKTPVHHSSASRDDTSFIQEESQQQHHTAKHQTPDLRHAKDMSVDELTKLASKHIKAGDRVVRKIQDFHEQIMKKDPQKFKSIGHNLLHEPTVHHRHHTAPTPSSMLETSSSIERHPNKIDTAIPDILIERAAQRATDTAENDIEALLAKANGAITTDKKLVHDIGGFHDKIRSLKHEYEALAKSDAKDVATLAAEEAMITKATSSHHTAPKQASPITNEELSLLEDAASKNEHRGARRVRAKLGAQSEKRHRRKHGHS